MTTDGYLTRDMTPAVPPNGVPRHSDQTLTGVRVADLTADPEVTQASGGRRTTVILRYLLGRLAVDHFQRVTRWIWLVPVLGLGLLVVKPRWIGLAVVVLGVLLLVARRVAVGVVRRVSLASRFRPVEEELCSAVEAGKANLGAQLRAAGLPSRSWRLALFATRLASSSNRSDLKYRLRQIDVDRVLPRAQLERALKVLESAGSR